MYSAGMDDDDYSNHGGIVSQAQSVRLEHGISFQQQAVNGKRPVPLVVDVPGKG